MAARILEACDAAAALIEAGWPDRGDADGAARVYAPPVGLTADAETRLTGRRVFVFPGPYTAEQLDRESQWRRYTVRVLAVEQYAGDLADDAGPPREWVDERVTWFADTVFDPLANQSLVLVGEMIPAPDEQAVIDVLYDADFLLQHKAFWSVATFVFAEPTDLAGNHP